MKTALITGAQGGVGRALVEVFKKNDWEVIGAYRADVDISNQQSIEKFVSSLSGKPIDVLVNVAGIYDATSVDHDDILTDIDKISTVFRVNVIGTRLLTDALLPNLQKGQEKLVVSLSSVMSTRAAMDKYHAEHWVYGASKSALNYAMIAFNKTNPEIKSVLVHPGWVKTSMGGKSAPVEPSESAQGIFDLVENHQEKLPNGRLVSYDGKLMEF